VADADGIDDAVTRGPRTAGSDGVEVTAAWMPAPVAPPARNDRAIHGAAAFASIDACAPFVTEAALAAPAPTPTAVPTAAAASVASIRL
jgi:hypothetical protein